MTTALSIPPPARGGTPEEFVTVAPDGAAVHLNLVDREPEVVAAVQAGILGDEPVEGAKRALRLGLMVEANATTNTSLVALQKAAAQIDGLKSLPHQIAEQLALALSGELKRVLGSREQPGALAITLDVVTQEATAKLRQALMPVVERLIGADPNALPQLLEQRLTGILTRESRLVIGQMLATDGTSPLMVHLEQGSRAIEQLRREQSEFERRVSEQITKLAHEVVIEKTSVATPINAGRKWEQDALDDVARIAAVTGDTLEMTGSQSGHAGARLGDGVLCLAADNGPSGLKVAIECRTGAKRLTRDALMKAVQNRDAHAGLLLAECPEALPSDAEATGLRIYWDHSLVVLHHDRTDANCDKWLAFAVRAAALLARLANSAEGQRFDRATIKEAARRIESSITHMKPIRACVSGAEKELGKLLRHAADMEADARAALHELTVLTDAA